MSVGTPSLLEREVHCRQRIQREELVQGIEQEWKCRFIIDAIGREDNIRFGIYNLRIELFPPVKHVCCLVKYPKGTARKTFRSIGLEIENSKTKQVKSMSRHRRTAAQLYSLNSYLHRKQHP